MEAQLKEIDREVKKTEQTSQRRRKGSSVRNNAPPPIIMSAKSLLWYKRQIKLPPILTRIQYYLKNKK